MNTSKAPGSIANTLKFWFLFFSLVPLTIFALISYQQTKSDVYHLADQKLRNTSVLAARFVRNWFEYRMFDIINQSDSHNNRAMLQQLKSRLKQSNLTPIEFVQTDIWRSIVRTPHRELQRLIKQYDYIENLYLIDIDGNVLYSELPSPKLGANLLIDDIGNIGIADNIKQAIELDSIQFSNKTLYEKDKNKITGFMVAPMHVDDKIHNDGGIIGTFVMQIRFDRIINALIVNTGSSLTHYLVGDDAYLRSAYKNSPGELLKQTITTKPILQWLRLPASERKNMSNDASHYKGPQGNQVIGIINTIQIANINWALVSEIDEDEAMQALSSIAMTTLMLELLTIFTVIIFTQILISKITRPILNLRDAMLDIAHGGKKQEVSVETDNEINTLAQAFNHLLTNKREYEQTLLENTRKIELILDSTAAGTWDWSVQTQEISLSEQWAELIGYELSELGLITTDTWMQLMHPDDRKYSDQAMYEHWNKKTDRYFFESRVQHKNGSWIWVLDTGQVVEWHTDGKPKRMVGTRIDINDRKIAEQQLKRLSRIASESTNGILITNTEGLIDWINEGFTRLSGYSFEDVKNKTPGQILHGSQTPIDASEKIKSAMNHLQHFDVETIYYRKNGQPYWVSLSGNPLLDDHSKLEGFIFVATDINDQKIASLKLAQQQDMLEQMSLLGSIGAWEVDLQNNKIYWSSMTKKIHEVPEDYQPELASAINFYKEGESREEITRLVQQGIEKGTPWNIELPMITAKGREIWVAASGKSDFHNGKNVRLFGSFQDITDRKKIENDIIQAKNKAEAATEAKNQFLATMSHEIRTPMNGVIGMLNLVARSKLNEKQQRQIDIAKSSADSLLAIINDILDFSKVEAGEMHLELLNFDLYTHISDFTESMALKTEEKDIELILDMTAITNPWLKGDPGRLRQIFTNLVSNAIKFTESGEIIITCRIENDGEKYVFHGSVSDTGIGIPDEKRALLFDAFTQVDASTTREFGGTGLGLAIVKKLCRLMDGNISLEEGREKGSCFNFSVSMEKSLDSDNNVTSPQINGLSILIIDKNLTNCKLLKRQLTLWGAEVVYAVDSGNAIEVCQLRESKPFDLIFIEIKLFASLGVELKHKLQAANNSDKTRFIEMTYFNRYSSNNKFHEDSFDDYLTKPVTPKDLHKLFANEQNRQPGASVKKQVEVIPESDLSDDIPIENKEPSKPTDSKRVLVVDDNPINQEVACNLLEALQVSTHVASGGLEAIEELQASVSKQAYKLVLMDCQMPGMDGYEATRQIRQGKAGASNADIAIIAVTANAMKGDKEKCLQAGMNDYISKPLAPEILETKLKQVLFKQVTLDAVKTEDASLPTQNIGSAWDYDSLLKRVRGKEERVKRLVEMFVSDMPSRINELTSMCKESQFKEIGDIAHTIKGVSGNLGATALHQVMAEFESAAKIGDQNKISELMPSLVNNYNQLESRLNDYLGSL